VATPPRWAGAVRDRSASSPPIQWKLENGGCTTDTETIGIHLNKAAPSPPRRIVVFATLLFFAVVFAMPLLWMRERVHSSRERGPADPRDLHPLDVPVGHYSRPGNAAAVFLNSVKLAR